VESLADANEMARWLGERRDVLAYDTESGGLNAKKDPLRLVQLGDERTGWAVPWPLWGGLVVELLTRYEGDKVAHHKKFDDGFLHVHAGLPIPALGDDTMIQLALADPTYPKGLKPASARLIDPRATAGEKLLHDGMRDHGWTWATVPYTFPPYWVYAALDPVLTAHLHRLKRAEVRARCEDLYQLELAVSRICGRMSLAGVLIDRPYVTNALEKLRGYTGRVRSWLSDVYGVTSLASGRQLYQAFLQAGYAITDTTPTGMPKVDKDTLAGIAAAGFEADAAATLGDGAAPPAAARLAKLVIDGRHADKVINGYLENFLELVDADDVIHAGINTIQARTGRMSVTEPALQTLHRDDKIVRGCFIPRPGHVFVTVDFSQVEMRLAAALSEDPGLIQAFYEADNGGRDFYSGIASELFGVDVPKSDPRRQAVKTMSYAKLYGAGVPTMARSIGLPQARVRVIHDAFNERFPGLERMARELSNRAYAMKRAGERPATFTTMNRYLPCDPGREFALMNYKLQAEAADALKRAIVSAANAGLEDELRLPVHDELIAEVEERDAEEALRTMIAAMTDRDSYAVPLTCDGKILRERWVKS
jgi:DNA polymerase-1